MSAREIIEQIEALPPNEKAEVVDYVKHIAKGSTGNDATSEVRYVTDEEFERARKKVFALHAPLLKKLAE